MHGQAKDVDDVKAVALEQKRKRAQAKDGKMLVIKRIPLQFFQEIACVHDLKSEQPAGCQDMVGRLQDRAGLMVVRETIAARHVIHGPDALAYGARGFKIESSGYDVETLAARDRGDVFGVIDAHRFRAAGLQFSGLPSEADLSRLVHVFAKSVIPGSDQIRGQRITLLDDADAYQIGKALGGMLVASVTGRTTNYVSGGERNSHQGPPGGNIVAAVVRAET